MHARPSDECGDVAEPFVGAGDECGGISIDVELYAGNWPDSAAFCFQSEPNDAAKIGGVGYSYAMVSEFRGAPGKHFGGDSAVAE